jgi:hypothetical protein
LDGSFEFEVIDLHAVIEIDFVNLLGQGDDSFENRGVLEEVESVA